MHRCNRYSNFKRCDFGTFCMQRTYVLTTFCLLLLSALHMATLFHPYFTSSMIPSVYRGSARCRQFIDVGVFCERREKRNRDSRRIIKRICKNAFSVPIFSRQTEEMRMEPI